jgi:hypothetical protein
MIDRRPGVRYRGASDVMRAGARHATGGVYVNFMPEDETDRAAGTVAATTRPATLKAKYDPANVFWLNQNVPPKT